MIGPSSASAAVIIALLLGGGLLVVATALALRPRSADSSFAWMVIAGCATAILSLAAALHLRESDGFRASVVQLCAVGLAAVLGALCLGRPQEGTPPAGLLGVAGRGCAWLTLVGLAPTAGFSAKVMVYHALLGAGWGGVTALAMAAGAAGLAPALWAVRAPPPPALGGVRAALAVVLIGLLLALGLFPQPLLDFGGLLGKVAKLA